jgi:hypothetical protein
MTQIGRISPDEIRADPPNLSHPRSIGIDERKLLLFLLVLFDFLLHIDGIGLDRLRHLFR